MQHSPLSVGSMQLPKQVGSKHNTECQICVGQVAAVRTVSCAHIAANNEWSECQQSEQPVLAQGQAFQN